MSKKPIDQEYIWSKRNAPDWRTITTTMEILDDEVTP